MVIPSILSGLVVAAVAYGSLRGGGWRASPARWAAFLGYLLVVGGVAFGGAYLLGVLPAGVLGILGVVVFGLLLLAGTPAGPYLLAWVRARRAS